MKQLTEALACSPELFPAALELPSGAVTLWRLARADYEKSAFLDGRIAVGKNSRRVPYAVLAQAAEAAGLPESCHFIFHIGHVGSTLLSRLLARHPALFSLREPDVLRTLATLEKSRRDPFLPGFLKLWSRTFEPGARTVIKTTSFVSEIAVDLLSRPHCPHALAITVPPDVYLATIFGGANAPAEARALAPFRLARTNRRLSATWRLESFGEGEIVALGWVCETLCLAEAAQTDPTRVLVIDFEKFLADPPGKLRDAFAHFDVLPTTSEVSAMLSDSDMRSYSKAPEYAYDAGMRCTVLAEGRTRYANEIRQGLAWLERVAADHPSIANTLNLFA